MSLFDQYGGVKKHGYQVYKKDNYLIYKALCDKTWDSIYPYFTTDKNDLNLVLYLGGNGITATYTDYYCSRSNLPEIEKHLKAAWPEVKKSLYIF